MRRKSGKNAGFTMVELLMACSVLAVGACGLAAVLVQSMTLSAVNAETSDAQASARQVIERLSQQGAETIFASYNATDADNLATVSESPGDLLILERKGGTGSLTAQIIFPSGSDPSQLREDVKIPALGMPRDLNGDGEIDSLDHSKDYRILPVLIRVRWTGFNGVRTYEMATTFVNSPVEFELTASKDVQVDIPEGEVPLGAVGGEPTNALEALLLELYN